MVGRIGRIGLLTLVIAGVIPSIAPAQAVSWQAGVDSALGRKGAAARHKALTAQERSRIAKKAAKTRWNKTKAKGAK